ncbi:MAG: VOC family protein, partial [Candidatus Parcubacteria bacterium]|nr:VOC family protein [Candidatus Parcubacteria bacterium]
LIMKIHHTALTVLSLEKSVEFYQDVFGLKVEGTFTKEESGIKFVLMSDENGGRIELFEFKDSTVLPESQNNFSTQGIKHIAFESEDVEAVWTKLKDKYECTDVKNGVSAKYFFIKDPTNIPLEIYQKK